MNFAPLGPVNDLHRHELDTLTRRDEREQLLGFDFELRRAQINPLQGREPQQTKPALAVGQFLAGQRGKLAAHPAIHRAAKPRHPVRFSHPIAHDE